MRQSPPIHPLLPPQTQGRSNAGGREKVFVSEETMQEERMQRWAKERRDKVEVSERKKLRVSAKGIGRGHLTGHDVASHEPRFLNVLLHPTYSYPK